MANIVVSSFLPSQHFTSNPLDRHGTLLARFRQQQAASTDGEVSLIVVSGREVVVRPGDSTPGVLQDLQALLLRANDPELELGGEQLLLRWTPSGCHWQAAGAAPDKQGWHQQQQSPRGRPRTAITCCLAACDRPCCVGAGAGDGAAPIPPIPLPLYLLGLDVQERWTFAVDIGSAKQQFMVRQQLVPAVRMRSAAWRSGAPGSARHTLCCRMLPAAPHQEFLRSGCELEVSLKDLRLLLPTLSLDAAAIAGQAVALSTWHQVRCGSNSHSTSTNTNTSTSSSSSITSLRCWLQAALALLYLCVCMRRRTRSARAAAMRRCRRRAARGGAASTGGSSTSCTRAPTPWCGAPGQWQRQCMAVAAVRALSKQC